MKTKLIPITIFTLMSIASAISLCNLFQYNKDKYTLECQVLDLYLTKAGYKVEPRFIAIVKVNPFNTITELNLSPSNYYKSKQALQNKNLIKFKFSERELDKFKNQNLKWYNKPNTFLILIMLTAAIGLYLLFSTIFDEMEKDLDRTIYHH